MTFSLSSLKLIKRSIGADRVDEINQNCNFVQVVINFVNRLTSIKLIEMVHMKLMEGYRPILWPKRSKKKKAHEKWPRSV